MSGYLAGIVANGRRTPAPRRTGRTCPMPNPSSPAVGRITIAYGTETGNSKKLATDFAAKAKKKGIPPSWSVSNNIG